MQPAAFDRSLTKGASAPKGAASALALGGQSSSSSRILTAGSKLSGLSDSDAGTDSDEDVLKLPDPSQQAAAGSQSSSSSSSGQRRQSQQFQVSSQGQFGTPSRGGGKQQQASSGEDDNISTTRSQREKESQLKQESSIRNLADKFFDPKLVRVRAETNRKKSAKTAIDALGEEAAALGPSAAKTAEKSIKLSANESKCTVQFAPTACCIDENPSDILRPQVPPALEHSTMVSFEAENLLVVFGGLCLSQNDAVARASVEVNNNASSSGDDDEDEDDDDYYDDDEEDYDDDDDDDYEDDNNEGASGGRRKKNRNKRGGEGSNNNDNEENPDDKDPESGDTPECGVASNTVWLYDTKNLIWSCVTEHDVVEQQNQAENANEVFEIPAPRCGHTAVAMFDDPLPQPTTLPFQTKKASAPTDYAREPMMVIFGGCDLRKQVSFGDVWAFFIRQRRWKCLFSSTVVPRGNLTFSLDSFNLHPAGDGNGGEDGEQKDEFNVKRKNSFFPDDAAFFEGEDVRARLLALTGNVTGAKLHAAATAKRPIRKAKPPSHRWKAVAGSFDELMFVFGGESTSFDVLDDLHTFNCITMQWEVQRARMSSWPSARFMHSACCIGTKMVVSGGTGKRADLVLEDDTWILEMRTLMWRQVTGTNEVLSTSRTVEDALSRCPFLTRPRHVPQVPNLISPMERKLDLKVNSLLSSPSSKSSPSGSLSPAESKYRASLLSTVTAMSAQVVGSYGTNNIATATSLAAEQQQRPGNKEMEVARCEVEGPILLPFDDKIIFYGGREVPTGRFIPCTYVLDLISERWFRADDILMDQSNLLLHGDIRQLTSLPVTEKTDSMLPAKRWAHCGAAVIRYSPTQHMSLTRTLSEVAQECGGSNICGTVRFTDQRAVDKYISNLKKDVEAQAKFEGVLFTRLGKPIMAQTMRAFFFGGGSTCSVSGATPGRKSELSDCWQMNLNIVDNDKNSNNNNNNSKK